MAFELAVARPEEISDPMQIHKISFLLLITMFLTFGCTHYPSGFFVKTNSVNQKFQSDMLICHSESEKNANLIIPKFLLTSMEYYPVRTEEAMGALLILAVSIPIEMDRRLRWVNVYFNTMKACMEEQGYSWISDPEGPRIGSFKGSIRGADGTGCEKE